MAKTNYDNARLEMVDCQVRPSDVTHYHILDTMLKVPREEFFPENLRAFAYVGANIEIGDGRYSLEPRIIGKMLNIINIKGDELVLNIGSGFGYAVGLIANFAQAVVMVEEQKFAREAERILLEQSIDNVIVRGGQLSEGAIEHGPYDAIIIEGGVEVVPPTIVRQLKIGGRIVTIFMNEMVGECSLGLKTQYGVDWQFGFNATAPLLRGFGRKNIFKF